MTHIQRDDCQTVCGDSMDYSSTDECPESCGDCASLPPVETLATAIAPETSWGAPEKKSDVYRHPGSVSVFDVAAYILFKLGEMSTMKLQKLVYYCQAWSLVWDEQPLYHENIEAWANGPVVRELFDFHRGRFVISTIEIGNSDLLNESQKETVDAVLDYYGDKSAQWLIDLSHMEEPWKTARRGMTCSERCNRVITLDAIADYYSSLPSEE